MHKKEIFVTKKGYIFSDRKKLPKKCSKDHKLPKKCSKTKVAQKLLERPKVAKKLPSNLCKSLVLRTHFSRKNTRMFILIELQSINSWISIKIKTRFVDIGGMAMWRLRFPMNRVVQGSIPRRVVSLSYF